MPSIVECLPYWPYLLPLDAMFTKATQGCDWYFAIVNKLTVHV